jgi:DNA-binding NtrC family response regulator
MDSSGRILIACSSAEYKEKLAEILKAWALEMTIVSTPAEVQALLPAQAPALVICEDQLAEGTYHEVLDVLSAAKSPARLLVLIHDETKYSEAMQSGAFDAIPVPFRRSDAQWAVIRALQAKASHGANSHSSKS